MENDRLIELLILTRNSIIMGRNRYQSGICKCIIKLYENMSCSYIEYKQLQRYITKNKPNSFNQYKHYTNSQYWIDDEYWWQPINLIPETKQIRIDYLNELIDNIK